MKISTPDFTKTIALFGGAFDPPHLGHLHVAALIAHKVPEIEQLYFLPAYQSPGKHAPFANPQQRLHWLHLLLEGTPFGIWDEELKSTQSSFTIDTLRKARSLGAKPDRLYFVLGSDSYAKIHLWKEYEEILRSCTLLVVSRDDAPIAPRANVRFLAGDCHEASSTEIRQNLLTGKSCLGLLPQRIEQEIKDLTLQGKSPYAKTNT